MDEHPLYLCDPEKNTACRKTGCKHDPNAKYHHCMATRNPAFAKLDENGAPIPAPSFLDIIQGGE